MRQSNRRKPTPHRRPSRTPRRTTQRRTRTNTQHVSQRQMGGLLLLIVLLGAAGFVWFRNRTASTPIETLDEPAAVLSSTATSTTSASTPQTTRNRT